MGGHRIAGVGARRPADVAVALTLAACLVGLLIWWARMTEAGRIGSVAVLDRPAGSEVVLSLLTVLSIDDAHHYVLGHAALRIPVEGDAGGLTVGEEVTVGGTVERGFVRAEWCEHAPARPLKRRLGLVGLAVGVALGGAAVRRGAGGLVLRG